MVANNNKTLQNYSKMVRSKWIFELVNTKMAVLMITAQDLGFFPINWIFVFQKEKKSFEGLILYQS